MNLHLQKVLSAFALAFILITGVNAQQRTILIDFGDDLSDAPWNNVVDPVGANIVDLGDITNVSTGIGLNIFDAFNNINRAGSTDPMTSLNFPATATGDSFFGNVAVFGGQEQPTAGVKLTGLTQDVTYTFSIYASRVASDNRETEYILDGLSTDSLYLNISSNDTEIVVGSMKPDENGEISIYVGPGPNNDNSSGFYYLGAMQIDYEESLEPNIDTILVDFGDDFSPAPWNNVSDPNVGVIEDLLLSNGYSSNRGIAVTDSFNNINRAGTMEPDSALGMPPTATGDSFFGNVAVFGGQVQPTGAVMLSGFDPSIEVTIEIFASRTASDNRETEYKLTGATQDSVYLNISSNTGTTVTSTLFPDADGNILIEVGPGPNNDNSSQFYYLGAMRVIYENNEVVQPELTLNYPNGGEFWQVGKTPSIEWESKNVTEVILEYSTDAGSTWTVIDTANALFGEYEWTVPNTPSDEAIVRISGAGEMDASDNLFTISDDDKTCTVVVLGSSTAEGTGASNPDSAWVSLFRHELTQNNTQWEVVNLARGGYTTFHILPTGSEIPSEINISIDEERNLTKALEFDPTVIIVNMPSNDAARNIGVDIQMENFNLLYNDGQAEGAKVFICTTQPRNFTNADLIQIQTDTRDSILATFGDQAIDFWTPLANEENLVADDVDSGDGVHVNNLGHRLLYEQVLGKQIDTISCSGMVNVNDFEIIELGNIRAYPNPFENTFAVEFDAPETGELRISAYNNIGQLIYTKNTHIHTAGINQQVIDLSSLKNTQLIRVKIDFKNEVGIASKVINLIKL